MLKELSNTSVICETEAEHSQLMHIYEDAGWNHPNYDNPPTKHMKENQALRSCFPLEVTVEPRFSYQSSGKNIPLSEFLRIQGIVQMEDLKEGDWVEVVEEFKSISECATFETGRKYRVKSVEHPSYSGDAPIELTEDGMGLNFGWTSRTDLSKLRKCSPPEKPTASEYKLPIDFGKHDNSVMQWFVSEPAFITSPHPIMDCCKSAVSFLREQALSKSERTLRKVGFKDNCGNWTGEARDAAFEMLMDERKDDLVKLAEEIVKEEEK